MTIIENIMENKLDKGYSLKKTYRVEYNMLNLNNSL